MNIYDYDNYKLLLLEYIKLNQAIRGYQGKLAEAARCSPSYLSQALKGKQELTPDQAINLAVHLNLNQHETEYFLTLVNFSRAVNPPLKDFLRQQLQALKEAQNKLSVRIKQSANAKDLEAEYYSSWMYAAVHLITSSEDYQEPEAISLRLGIPILRIKKILSKLEAMDLIEKKKGKWVYKNSAAHLPDDSHMTELNHLHWRNRAILDVQKGSGNESLHYSSTFTMSKKDYVKLKKLLLDTVENSRKLIGSSGTDELYSFNCDLFKV